MALDFWRADEEGTRTAFGGELPTADAAVLIGAVQAMMPRVPVLPDQDPTDPSVTSARRAQALVLVCTGRRLPVPRVDAHRAPTPRHLVHLPLLRRGPVHPGPPPEVGIPRRAHPDAEPGPGVLVHHKLVHEHGRSVERDPATGHLRWYRPDGTRYRGGPDPPGPQPPGPDPPGGQPPGPDPPGPDT
jgi:hypothetical protein